jgi:hypothetical protein
MSSCALEWKDFSTGPHCKTREGRGGQGDCERERVTDLRGSRLFYALKRAGSVKDTS